MLGTEVPLGLYIEHAPLGLYIEHAPLGLAIAHTAAFLKSKAAPNVKKTADHHSKKGDHHANKASRYESEAQQTKNTNKQALLRKKAERHAQEAKQHRAKGEAAIAAHKQAKEHEANAHAQAEHIAHHTSEMNRHLAEGRLAEASMHQHKAAAHKKIAEQHFQNSKNVIQGKAVTQVAQAPSREGTLNEWNAERSGAVAAEHASNAAHYEDLAQKAKGKKARKLLAKANDYRELHGIVKDLHEHHTELVKQEKLDNEKFQQKAAQHSAAPRHH